MIHLRRCRWDSLTAPTPPSSRRYGRMTPQQRVDAMWACQLSLSQLCEWSSRRPSEVPKLGREFAWLVMHTPEWTEPVKRQDNVVQLPQRGAHRAAA